MRDELLIFIRQWRIYKSWEPKDDNERAHYARLTADYATIIRRRIHQYEPTQSKA